VLVSLRKVSKSCDASVRVMCDVDAASSCFERAAFCMKLEDTEGLMVSEEGLKGLVVIWPRAMDADGSGSGRCRIDMLETDLYEVCG